MSGNELFKRASPRKITPLSEASAAEKIQAFEVIIAGHENHGLLDDLANSEPFRMFLANVFDLSPYLHGLALKNTALIDEILGSSFEECFEKILEEMTSHSGSAADEKQLMSLLRQSKAKVALLCGLADMGGWWPMQKVTQSLSDFADCALQATVQFLMQDAAKNGLLELSDVEDAGTTAPYTVLAMGKHGAGELNYSSDIDIVVFYDPQSSALDGCSDPATLFSRLTKRLVKIMQERTADGYVFRTDLRLRPDPGSTPLAIPVDAAMHYYESKGQNWERAAMIKARCAAGNQSLGAEILAELNPFVWRKFLDFAAIDDIHSIKRQIHAHKGHSKIAVAGHNIKLGRGGIREIEFFVQTQQLIAGGRVPELRGRSTLKMLTKLSELEWISKQACEDLSGAYCFLRNVEHRLQMVSDQQTHTLPEDQNELRRIAFMSGFETLAEFSTVLELKLSTVEGHYVELFETAPELTQSPGNLSFTGDDPDPDTLVTLQKLGFSQPAVVISIIRGWHYGRYKATQSPQARERLTELTPGLIDVLVKTGNPDAALAGFDKFLAGLPAGLQLFSLLKSNPALLELLMRVLAAAPRLATIITRKPHIFDGLLEPGFFEYLPDREWLSTRLQASMSLAQHYEDGLDRARRFCAEQKFLIGVRFLTRAIDPRQAGRAFADLAEVLVNAMLKLAIREFEKLHGTVSGGEVAIVGMGKLGSGELTAGSDLDLIFVYSHDKDAARSTGDRPLAASQYFIRLAQRFIAAMSAPTAEGELYEIDFRLRPSGKAGPLATHIDAFIKYQSEQAWTWEHMALTRAKVLAGDTAISNTLNEAIQSVVSAERDDEKLRRDICSMRRRLEVEKPPKTVWDIKLAAGGLIDLEFIAQWLVLSENSPKSRPGQATRDVLENANTSTLTNDKVTLLKALYSFEGFTQLVRLCVEGEFDPYHSPKELIGDIVARFDAPDIERAELSLSEMQQDVRTIFDRIFGCNVD